MTELVVADIGGTHARFAIAIIADGEVVSLTHKIKMKASDQSSLQIAWEAYARTLDREMPSDAAFAVAGTVGGDIIRFTNSSWKIRPSQIMEKLHLQRYTLVNDFGAVGHAVARMDDSLFGLICGPDRSLNDRGLITVVGPGTGLGVAYILQHESGYHVTETEGGHVDFAPLDSVEDQLLDHHRKSYRRVSAERIVSGPGLAGIYRVLADLEKKKVTDLSDQELWELALSGTDSLASAAFDRFCLCLGSVTGDLALAQGARAVIMAGGLGQRIAERLPSSGFSNRFIAKGRFQSKMEQIPVYQLLHDEPGLYGAAAAFIHEHGTVV